MADTYTINASNQIVTGTAASEVFEFVSSSTNNTFTNVVINAAGGKDTIKATTSQTIDATITGLDKSSVLDFGDRYANDFYYATPADGIELTNYSGSFKMKFSGLTDASIVSQLIVVARQQQTKWDDYLIGGTDLADTISVNHLRCDAKAYGGDDIILTAKNDNLLNGNSGNDILVATGSNNTLQGEDGQDVLICGGSNNIVNGGDGNDTFEIYSYALSGSNNTLTGGNGSDEYIMSTGLVNVDGAQVSSSAYNFYTSDVVNATITDAKAGDSYYLRDREISGITTSTTSDGIVISSTNGRINITLAGQSDWNAVKDNFITLDNAQGFLKTCTLEQAINLGNTNAIALPTASATPAGIFVGGNVLTVRANFVGNLIMSASSANYINDQILTIDATQNNQVGMQIGGNSNANEIYAGQGGNVLWGGQDTAKDYLVGGDGADVFLIGKNDGDDAVFNAGNNDVIHLYDVTLDDIASYNYTSDAISLDLKSGNVISLVNSDPLSPKFMLADGSAYRFNRAGSAEPWQSA